MIAETSPFCFDQDAEKGAQFPEILFISTTTKGTVFALLKMGFTIQFSPTTQRSFADLRTQKLHGDKWSKGKLAKGMRF